MVIERIITINKYLKKKYCLFYYKMSFSEDKSTQFSGIEKYNTIPLQGTTTSDNQKHTAQPDETRKQELIVKKIGIRQNHSMCNRLQ